MPLTPEQRKLRAQLAAHRLHATHDSRILTAPARAKFMERFLNEVDPEHRLPEAERQRRAGHARKAYFTKLALVSSRARAKKAS